MSFIEIFSLTENFYNEEMLKEFVCCTDAAVKYGVYYKNWSLKDYIHNFKSKKIFLKNKISTNEYGKLLLNKDTKTHVHDFISNKLWKFIRDNQVSLEYQNYPHSWHFDAAKMISFLKTKCLRDEKVNFFDDKIVNCKFSLYDQIQYFTGESGKKYFSDYFINCCGDNKLNEEILKEKYINLSPYLLTNKALVYPLEYTDIRKQFRPYTVSKTMKHGWRWITPTQSRIGTGYVFSDNHVSIDEATEEFVNDLEDKKIEPKLIDFTPKINLNSFKVNSCTIGMSNGFLEPLDAPGLDLMFTSIKILIKLLKNKLEMNIDNNKNINCANSLIQENYNWWASFILHQYKTCYRNDTLFWKDHKNVKFDFYENLIEKIILNSENFFSYESMMFYHTSAGKDFLFKSKIKEKPFIIEELETKTIHHLDYIQTFYD